MNNPHAALPRARLLIRQDFDPTVPNVARIYDCLLGGKDNFAADREAAARLLAAVPGAATAARENRAFLHRAVRFLCQEAGIRQFLDVGAGLPTGGSVHEIVEGAVPPAHVVYADYDPVVLRHADAMIGGRLGVAAVQADLRQPRHLLTHPTVQSLIDFGQPVAVLLVAVLHFLEDREDPWAVVNWFKDQVAPGSYLVISHVTAEHLPAAAARQARAAYENASAPGVPRTREQIARFFGGLEMLSPGLVSVPDWRPAHIAPAAAGPVLFYAGIGRKTAPGKATVTPASGQAQQEEDVCWREAARMRSQFRGWIVIWLAPENCYRAYRRLSGARRDTALSAATSAEMAALIGQAEQAAAARPARRGLGRP